MCVCVCSKMSQRDIIFKKNHFKYDQISLIQLKFNDLKGIPSWFAMGGIWCDDIGVGHDVTTMLSSTRRMNKNKFFFYTNTHKHTPKNKQINKQKLPIRKIIYWNFVKWIHFKSLIRFCLGNGGGGIVLFFFFVPAEGILFNKIFFYKKKKTTKGIEIKSESIKTQRKRWEIKNE